jgi:hypothetical protein
MQLERFLLLWDDLDDYVGIARHATFTAVAGLAGTVAAFMAAGRIPTGRTLTDTASEP